MRWEGRRFFPLLPPVVIRKLDDDERRRKRRHHSNGSEPKRNDSIFYGELLSIFTTKKVFSVFISIKSLLPPPRVSLPQKRRESRPETLVMSEIKTFLSRKKTFFCHVYLLQHGQVIFLGVFRIFPSGDFLFECGQFQRRARHLLLAREAL